MIRFTVYGTPAPAGSKRGFYNAKAKRVIVTDDSKRSRPWKAQVADAAVEAMLHPDDGSRTLVCRPLLEGPLAVVFTFYVTRPKGHYGARGLKPSAPDYPTVKPDVLKLARAVEDALSQVVYRDDSQIVTERLQKRYGEPARVEVEIREAGETPALTVEAA